MVPKLIVLAACLFSMAAAQDPSLFGEEEDEPRPAYFIQAELLFYGLGLSTSEIPMGSARLLHIGFENNRVRLGLALLDVDAAHFLCLLPVTAGYAIYERPVGYAGSLYTKVPEVYVEATVGFINTYAGNQLQAAEIPFRGTLELACSVDGYGAGASVAAGCYYYYDASYQAGESGLYAVARFHLLRFRWGS